MPDTAPRVPAGALLPWLLLDDAALVERLPWLADFLGEAGDEREVLVRKSSVFRWKGDSEGACGIWWPPAGFASPERWTHAAAIAELASRVRELLGATRQKCDHIDENGQSAIRGCDHECNLCHGRGWVVVPTT